MVIHLIVPAKYEGKDYPEGETLEVTNDVGKLWIEQGSATFVGFRCPSCPAVIGGDTIAEAQKKYAGHTSKHGKEKLKKEGKERVKKAKEGK